MALGDCESVLPFRLMTRTETHDTSVSDSLLASKEYATGEIVNVPVCTPHVRAFNRLTCSKSTRGSTCTFYVARRVLCSDVEFAASQLRCSPANCMKIGRRLSDFLAFADQVGYRLNGIYEQAYADNRLHQFNAVFVAPS